MATKAFRKFFRKFFIILNAIIAGLFLIACLVPYLNPSMWWFMGFLGLAFPYLALLLVFSIIFWWVVKPAISILPIITLLIGYKQLRVLFAFHKFETFTEKRDSTRIRIIDWNVRSLQGLSGKSAKKRMDRATIPETILTQNPDVVCLQEFNNSEVQNNMAPFNAKLPYHYFSKDFKRTKQGYQSGSIIFSKYPLLDSGRIPFPGRSGESIIYVDITMQGKTFRIFTTHLQSFKFSKDDYEGLDQIKHTDEKALPASKGIFSKMKLAFIIRGEQARLVRENLERSPHPSVICGDFNDVPNNFTYFHIKKDWQDAFLETSLGIGKTYLALAPTLRIDYILPDNHFNIHQFDMVDEDLSDHLMLVADVSFK